MSSLPYPWIIAAAAVLVAAAAGLMMLNQPAAVPADESAAGAAAALICFQSGVAGELDALDGRLSVGAFEIGSTGLNDDAARGILENLSVAHPAIVDCVVADAGGTIIAAEPAAYHGAEGADIRGQDHVRRLLSSKRPVMSEMITVAEGFPAVVIAAPVFTNESRFAGFVAAVIRPEILIGNVAGSVTNGTSLQVMVVQTDGRLLYDTDQTQVGRMTLEDPLYADYPDLLDTARRTAVERYGTATYEFGAGGEKVQKEIAWTTAGLHGTEWRVAVIRAVG